MCWSNLFYYILILRNHLFIPQIKFILRSNLECCLNEKLKAWKLLSLIFLLLKLFFFLLRNLITWDSDIRVIYESPLQSIKTPKYYDRILTLFFEITLLNKQRICENLITTSLYSFKILIEKEQQIIHEI